MKPEKPHYVYVRRYPDGSQSLVIMSKKQEEQELPLTVDLATQFASDFIRAARELHKREITQLSNKEQQKDMFNESVQASGAGSSDNPEAGRLSRVASI